MSGGAYGYAYRAVEDMADALERESAPGTLRLAFASHLHKVVTAMRAVEWVDSGDMSPGDEAEGIEACVVQRCSTCRRVDFPGKLTPTDQTKARGWCNWWDSHVNEEDFCSRHEVRP